MNAQTTAAGKRHTASRYLMEKISNPRNAAAKVMMRVPAASVAPVA